MQPAAEHPNAGVLCRLRHRVRRLGHLGEILRGKRHGAVIERDQIPRHLTTPFSEACSVRISPSTGTRAMVTDEPPRTHRSGTGLVRFVFQILMLDSAGPM